MALMHLFGGEDGPSSNRDVREKGPNSVSARQTHMPAEDQKFIGQRSKKPKITLFVVVRMYADGPMARSAAGLC